jgi:hypothetical protein
LLLTKTDVPHSGHRIRSDTTPRLNQQAKATIIPGSPSDRISPNPQSGNITKTISTTAV